MGFKLWRVKSFCFSSHWVKQKMKTAYLLLRLQPWPPSTAPGLYPHRPGFPESQGQQAAESPLPCCFQQPCCSSLQRLCLSWHQINCLCHVGSWNRWEAGEKVSPRFLAGTSKLFPAARPPYRHTQHRRWQCTSRSFTHWMIKELGGLELAALLKYHEGFWIQCPFTDNCYLRPSLAHIALGS